MSDSLFEDKVDRQNQQDKADAFMDCYHFSL